MNRILLLALASIVAVAYGQTFGFGGCPTVTVQNPINLNVTIGKWYEFARSINAPQVTGACHTSTIAINGTTMTVTNKQYDATLNGAEKVSTGTGTINSSVGKATITYSGTAVNYNILKTDYTNYIVIEACSDFFFFHFKNLWVLTRARFPSQSYTDAAYAELTAQKFDTASLNKTDQLICPIFH